MKKRTQHVVKHSSGWAVKKGGSSRASRVFSTQTSAIRYGTRVAKKQNAELFIHGRNGQIRERNSYGSDPFPPRG